MLDSSGFKLDPPIRAVALSYPVNLWPTRHCDRCGTTLRAPTWRRLAAMNARHHSIKKGALFTRCMKLRIERRNKQRDAELGELAKLILKAPPADENGVVTYEVTPLPDGLSRSWSDAIDHA